MTRIPQSKQEIEHLYLFYCGVVSTFAVCAMDDTANVFLVLVLSTADKRSVNIQVAAEDTLYRLFLLSK